MSYIPKINSTQISPSITAATSSTTLVMFGAAGSITPKGTGGLLIVINGDASNSTATSGYRVQISYGTGTTPTNGAALTGTQLGGIITCTRAQTSNDKVPFSTNGIVTGLTVGTTYWVDLAYSVSGAGAATIGDFGLSVIEL